MRRGTIALLLTVTWGAVGCVDGQRYDTQAAELLPSGMSGPSGCAQRQLLAKKHYTCGIRHGDPADAGTATKKSRPI